MKTGPASLSAVRVRRPHGGGEGVGQIPVTTPTARPRERGRKKRPWRWLVILALLAAVIAVDQAAKWWGWRHIPGADINPGGDFLTGPMIGRWYANPVTGALLDLVDCGLLTTAVIVLARRRYRLTVTVCGSLMVGGWASNLLDRLGMHYLTAPNSIRGVVDFISIGGYNWNLADFFIIGATPLLLLATTCAAHRAASRAPAGATTPSARDSSRARVPTVAVAGAALITTVALGAAHHGTLARPVHASRQSVHHALHPRARTAVGAGRGRLRASSSPKFLRQGCPSPVSGFVVGVTNTHRGSRAATEEDIMILVNSKDVVADRVRDNRALAATSGRARQLRGAGQPRSSHRLPGARRGPSAWAGIRVLARHSG